VAPRDDASGGAPPDRPRNHLRALVGPDLWAGEAVVAMFPYATVPKRRRGPEGKVRTGVQQSWRRYRPVVFTSQRVLVFDTGRTPHARSLLAEFPVEQVRLVSIAPPTRFGRIDVILDLPGLGPITFETGRRERDDVEVVGRTLGPD